MTDPAVEAAQRAVSWRDPNAFEITAAREALEQIRELHQELTTQGRGPETECWWRAVQYVLEELAPLIYTTEELER